MRSQKKERKQKQSSYFCPLFAHLWISAIKNNKNRNYLTPVIERLLRNELIQSRFNFDD